MKVFFLYSLLLLFSAGTALQAAIVIKGIADRIGVRRLFQWFHHSAAQVQTDAAGNFEVMPLFPR